MYLMFKYTLYWLYVTEHGHEDEEMAFHYRLTENLEYELVVSKH